MINQLNKGLLYQPQAAMNTRTKSLKNEPFLRTFERNDGKDGKIPDYKAN